METKPKENSNTCKGGAIWFKLGLFLLAAGIAALLFWQFGDRLKLETLAQYEQRLEKYQQDHPVLVYLLAFLVYVVVTGLSLPGAAILTLLYGWYFGLLRGVLLVSFASTTGATVAFLLSRYFFGSIVQQRFSKQLTNFNRRLEEEGAFYLFTLRMIAAVPFFIVNLVMGLTKIGVFKFWWISQLGMLPGTILYVYIGANVPDLQTLAEHGVTHVLSQSTITQLLIGFALLGTFPLLAKFIIKRIRKSSGDNNTDFAKDVDQV